MDFAALLLHFSEERESGSLQKEVEDPLPQLGVDDGETYHDSFSSHHDQVN